MFQQAISREMFNKLTPKAQGFWFQIQNSWNKQMPLECPYEQGTEERREWVRGQAQAIKEFEGSMEALA